MAASLSTDIILPNSPPDLLLPKHAGFLTKYGTAKDDYVSLMPQKLKSVLMISLLNFYLNNWLLLYIFKLRNIA